MDKEKQHHIWCNFWTRPREGCKQCEGLYEQYPIDENMTHEEFVHKYFPDVIVRTTPKGKIKESYEMD